MPSALEKLVKILRLEQDTGYRNTAVIGGLESFLATWTAEAHTQARTNEHHALVEELARAITHYGGLDNREKRLELVRYMLGRITNRVAPLPEYGVTWTDEDTARLGSVPTPRPSSPASASAPRERNRRQERRQKIDKKQAQVEAEHTSAKLPDVLETAFETVQIIPLADSPSEDHEEEGFEEEASTSGFDLEPVAPRRTIPHHLPKPRRTQRPSIDPDKAAALWTGLNASVEQVKGVGIRRGQQLAQLGIHTVGDLIFNFPRRYDDYTQVLPLRRLPPNAIVSAVGTIKEYSERYTRERRPYLRVVLEDDTAQLPIIFFGQPFLKRYFRVEMQIAVYGKTEVYLGKIQMTNPEWEEVDNDGVFEGVIVPVYSLTKGLSNKVMRSLTQEVLQTWAAHLPDYMPQSVLERAELVDLTWAIRQMHFPENPHYLAYARERLAFDELMILQLGVLQKRHDWQSVPGVSIWVEHSWLEEFLSRLPYPLTGAQKRAMEYILTDLAKNVPMNRLLQGDVGSGKTVVATIALAVAMQNNMQAAIMAPTSILAEQHYHEIKGLLETCLPLPPGLTEADVTVYEWPEPPAPPVKSDRVSVPIISEKSKNFHSTPFWDDDDFTDEDDDFDFEMDEDIITYEDETTEGMADSEPTLSTDLSQGYAEAEGERFVEPEAPPTPIIRRRVPVNIRLLTGATTGQERTEIYAGLADGSVQIVVGTHALIQEKVEFNKLALAVIDEQHRFGVDERAGLRGKGMNPHVLVMTATPIPRTLALTMYADLDLTVLDEMPPGRTPIQTRIVHPAQRERAYDFIRDELDQGRQAYIIYPLVEASESISARSAVEAYEELSASDFYGYRIGLIHGRLSPAEKDDIMGRFTRHELDVLVSTSVIEVGINVPNATVMMIEGANRFGLAQLHQLRGRVGRGGHKSYCFLLPDEDKNISAERLQVMEQTSDGFLLAERDWELRGAGDLLGTRQSGRSSESLNLVKNPHLVELAQIESRALFAEDPALSAPEHALLAQRVRDVGHNRTDIS